MRRLWHLHIHANIAECQPAFLLKKPPLACESVDGIAFLNSATACPLHIYTDSQKEALKESPGQLQPGSTGASQPAWYVPSILRGEAARCARPQ